MDNDNGVPWRCDGSYGASVFNVSISFVFWSWTVGSNKKHDTLFYFNSLSSSSALVALDTISLAPIPVTPILVT